MAANIIAPRPGKVRPWLQDQVSTWHRDLCRSSIPMFLSSSDGQRHIGCCQHETYGSKLMSYFLNDNMQGTAYGGMPSISTLSNNVLEACPLLSCHHVLSACMLHCSVIIGFEREGRKKRIKEGCCTLL